MILGKRNHVYPGGGHRKKSWLQGGKEGTVKYEDIKGKREGSTFNKRGDQRYSRYEGGPKLRRKTGCP